MIEVWVRGRTAHKTHACAFRNIHGYSHTIIRRLEGGLITLGDAYVFCRNCANSLRDDYMVLLAMERMREAGAI